MTQPTKHRQPTASDVADFLQWLEEEERKSDKQCEAATKEGRAFLEGHYQGQGTMAFRARMWIIERLTEHELP